MGHVKDYIVNWKHPRGRSQCADCKDRYCAFCDQQCPSCGGFYILPPGQPKIMRVYGQSGEDLIIWQLFKDNESPGFFLDVGALDGARFSNTLLFEKHGWKGICIEAHPDFVETLEKNRPNSTCLHAAAGDQDIDDFSFHANFLGTLSTIEPSLEGEFRQKYPNAFDGFSIEKVQLRKIDTILEQHKVSQLDFVSIDVEGGELKVLQGFNLEKHKPRIILIEAFNYDYQAKIEAIFAKAGYIKARLVANNLFFCRDAKDAKIIETVFPERIKITPTKNPKHQRCDIE